MTKNKFDAFAITAANYEALTPLSFLPRTALMFPDRRAVVYGERSYSWQEFYNRCKKLASALNKIGICKGDTVAVLAANTPEMIEAHFGIPMAGAVQIQLTLVWMLKILPMCWVMEKRKCLSLIMSLPRKPKVH